MNFDVVVVGSCNVDVVAEGDRLPAPGETVISRTLMRSAGGKGANQAVAAARAGSRCAMVGAVGEDADAELVLGSLREAGVDIGLVRRVEGPTGTALIVVDAAGENQIAVVPGANARLTDLALSEHAAVAAARAVLLQLEIPMSMTLAAAAAAHAAGVLVILNAAPAVPLPPGLLRMVDVLVVNLAESEQLGGARRLLESVPELVVTAGEEGAVYRAGRDRTLAIPAPRVRAVDSTGAGDAFTGYLAAAVAQGADVPEAMKLAVAAASIAVQRRGAAASIPSREEVMASL